MKDIRVSSKNTLSELLHLEVLTHEHSKSKHFVLGNEKISNAFLFLPSFTHVWDDVFQDTTHQAPKHFTIMSHDAFFFFMQW